MCWHQSDIDETIGRFITIISRCCSQFPSACRNRCASGATEALAAPSPRDVVYLAVKLAWTTSLCALMCWATRFSFWRQKKKRKDPTAAWPFKTGAAGDSPPEFAMAIGGALGRGIAAELALPNVQLLWFASIAAEIRYASLIYTTISRSTQSVFFFARCFWPSGQPNFVHTSFWRRILDSAIVILINYFHRYLTTYV